MSCPTEDAIAGFVGGTLPAGAREEMTAHLARCEECRALVSELARGIPVPPVVPSSAPVPPTFHAGDLVAERYRVVRFLAEGGMGEVYEAEDLELRARVALKTVRNEISAHPKMLARFKREIYFARKVTHPNVCRIFDMGFHVVGDARVAFLTMEFLEGETLADRVERGRMTSEEATPLALQMIAGLSAAHGEDVVHRDFKASNVMLVPRADGVRAIITDFGLARGSATDHFRTASTDEQGLVGSPAYMAPEQVANLEITHAADIYALGVVLFEMVTGTWPFIEQTAVLTALKRLTTPAPSPRTLVPDIDPRWEATIMRCLEREPAHRFQHVDDVGRGLTGPASSPAAAPANQVERPPLSSRRFAVICAVVVSVAAAAIATLLVARTSTRPSTATTPPSSSPSTGSLPAPSTVVASPPPSTMTTAPPAATTALAPPPEIRAHKSKTTPSPSNDHAIEHFILKYPEPP